jgi:hypothetical protein
MGELRRYLGEFLVSWERWACGGLSFAIATVATAVTNQVQRMLLVSLALVAFFIASFIVWRDEYRKNIEPPHMTEERQRMFDLWISQLRTPEVHFLRRVVVDGHIASNISILNQIAAQTGFLVEDAAIYKVNPTYKRHLEEWVKNSVDPTPQALGRSF